MHRTGIENPVAFGLKRLKKRSTDSIDLYDDFPEMMVSLIRHWRGKTNDDHDHDGKSDLLCIFQKYDEPVEAIHSALLEIVAIVHATIMHMVTYEIPTLEGFLQSQDSDGECQAAVKTITLLASLFTYEIDSARYDKQQWMRHYRSKSKSYFAPVYCTSLSIRP